MKTVHQTCIECGKEKGKTQSERCRSCFNRLRWKDPDYREYMKGVNESRWNDPSQKEKLSNRNRERWSNPVQRQNQSEWIKKKWNSNESRKRIIESMKSVLSKPEIRSKRSISRGGDGDVERIERAKQGRDEYDRSVEAQWSRSIKTRDGNQCQQCGVNKNLHAHHIKPRSKFPTLALDLDNGITLCRDCHLEEHKRLRLGTSVLL